jgi:hypothetical protein
MTTPGTLNDGKPLMYGFGLGVGAVGGHRQVSHNGGINGFISELHHYPDDSVVTVVLTNTGALAAVQLERLIARRTLGIKDLPAVPIDASAFERLVGQYAFGTTQVRVFVENGRLRQSRHPRSASNTWVVDASSATTMTQYEFAAEHRRRLRPAPGSNVTTGTRVPNEVNDCLRPTRRLADLPCAGTCTLTCHAAHRTISCDRRIQ